MPLLTLLASFFGTGVGAKIGSGIADGAKIVALLPILVWLVDKVAPQVFAHISDVALTVTWGQMGFMGVIGYFVIQLTHWSPSTRDAYARPPEQPLNRPPVI